MLAVGPFKGLLHDLGWNPRFILDDLAQLMADWAFLETVCGALSTADSSEATAVTIDNAVTVLHDKVALPPPPPPRGWIFTSSRTFFSLTGQCRKVPEQVCS